MPSIFSKTGKRLEQAVQAVCPGAAVSIGVHGVAGSVRLSFANNTPAQRANAQTIVDGFDWTDGAQSTWQTQENRDDAGGEATAARPQNVLIRAVLAVLLDEINPLRATFIPTLPARTLSQLRAAVQNKINSGAVDT